MNTIQQPMKKVWFDDENIYIRSWTGEIKHHPLAWFARRLNAAAEDRNNFELSPFGIHIGKSLMRT